MSKHRHRFVEVYDGMIAFGFSREVDENTIKYYLQKFSDDELLETLVPRLSQEEMHRAFDLLNELMKNHLSDDEYHRLFLKE
jgi:TorA maturation chaperone TorD